MLWYTVQFSYLLPPCQCTHSMNSISILRPTYTRHNPFHSLILSLFPLPTHFYCFTILCGSSAEANALYLLHHIFSRRSQERHKKNRVIISLPSRAPEKVKNRLLVDCVMACVCVASIAQFLHRNHKVQRRFMQHCFFFSIFVEILLWLRPTSNKRISSLHCVSELIKWGIDWLRLRQCMHACCASDAFFPLYSIHFFFVRDRLEISFIHYISFSLVWEPGTQLILHIMTMDYYIWLLLLQCCCLWGFSVILSATLRALRAHKQYCAMTLSRMALRKLCLLDFWANDLSWQQLCGSITAFLIWEYGTIEIASCNSDCMLSPIFIERKYRSVKKFLTGTKWFVAIPS